MRGPVSSRNGSPLASRVQELGVSSEHIILTLYFSFSLFLACQGGEKTTKEKEEFIKRAYEVGVG